MQTITEIRSLMSRADVLLAELTQEYEKCLKDKSVSLPARNLTHEVLEKCANALDQLMYMCWEIRIAPKISALPKRGGYFPAAKDEESYRSSLGQWNARDLREIDPEFDLLLRRYQPFADANNEWLAAVRSVAARKHTGLVPQKRTEEARVTVSRTGGGSVSWGSGVRFGTGVTVLGAPIDPRTQLPLRMPDVETSIEIWVGFQIDDTGLDAFKLCTVAVSQTKHIIEDFARTFTLGQ